jgi:hypothetical protein
MPFSLVLPTASKFKKAVMSLKDIIKDGIFYVTEQGLEFASLDAAQICIVEFRMDKSMFTTYTLDSPIALGSKKL